MQHEGVAQEGGVVGINVRTVVTIAACPPSSVPPPSSVLFCLEIVGYRGDWGEDSRILKPCD